MRRMLFALLTLFAVLVNAAHVEAHASGRHSHDSAAHDESHHGADADHATDGDDLQPGDDPAQAEHTTGHSHVAADRSLPVTLTGRLGARGSSEYLAFAQTPPPTAPRAPLLEPPSA